MSVDRMSLDSETRTRFKIDFHILGRRVLYGFWAVGRFHLTLPDRYSEPLKIDGRYTAPLCVVRTGGRNRSVTIKALVRKRGLKLWAWREAPLKSAGKIIVTELEKAKKSWDEERYNATSGTTGRAIL